MGQFPNLAFPFQGIATSCTLLTFVSQGTVITQPGTVTTASILVGPTTGRMRFVRLRNFYRNQAGTNGVRECCGIQEYGAIFTPTPNSVTTVTLNFRMTLSRRRPATTSRPSSARTMSA